jgi:hypothetical protein
MWKMRRKEEKKEGRKVKRVQNILVESLCEKGAHPIR